MSNLLKEYIGTVLKENSSFKKNIHIEMFCNFCELTFYLNKKQYKTTASNYLFDFVASKILKKQTEMLSSNESFIQKSRKFIEYIDDSLLGRFHLRSKVMKYSLYNKHFSFKNDSIENDKNINMTNYLEENYSYENDCRVVLEKYFGFILYLRNKANQERCLNVLLKVLKSKSIYDEFNIKNEKGIQLINLAKELLKQYDRVNKLVVKNTKHFKEGSKITISKILKVVDNYLENIPKKIVNTTNSIVDKSSIIQKKLTIYNKTIEKEDKIIYTESPIDLNIIDRQNFFGNSHGRLKPDGLWYSFGNEWNEFCQKNKFNVKKYNYKYLVEVDESKLYTISEESQLKLFESLYYVEPDSDGLDRIDWEKVEKDGYSGFQVKNWDSMYYKAIKNMQTDETWLAKYDISSGCIWNKNAIKEFYELNYKYTPSIFIYNDYEVESLIKFIS